MSFSDGGGLASNFEARLWLAKTRAGASNRGCALYRPRAGPPSEFSPCARVLAATLAGAPFGWTAAGWTREIAADFLLARTQGRRNATPEDAQHALALADSFDGDAYALEVAAADVCRSGARISDYCAEFAAAAARLPPDYDPRITACPRPLAAALDIAVARLPPSARDALDTLAMLAAAPIPARLVAAAARRAGDAAVFGAPIEQSLLRRRAGGDGVELPRRARLRVQAGMSPRMQASRRRAAQQWLTDALIAAYELRFDAQSAFLRALRPHVLETCRDASDAYSISSTRHLFARLGEDCHYAHLFEEALDAHSRAATAAARLIALRPANVHLAFDRWRSVEAAGDACLALRRLDDAGAHYQTALALAKPILAAKPYNSFHVRGFVDLLRKRGDLARTKGDFTAARRFFVKALRLAERVEATAPLRTIRASTLLRLRRMLARAARLAGDADAARSEFEAALRLALRRAARRPLAAPATEADSWPGDREPAFMRVYHQYDLAQAYIDLGESALQPGDARAALALFEKARRIIWKVRDKSPSNWGVFQGDLALLLVCISDLLIDAGELAEARRHLEPTLPLLAAAIAAAGADDPRTRDICALADERFGYIALECGRRAEALGWFVRALEYWRAQAASSPDDAKTLAALMNTLAFAAKASDAPASLDAEALDIAERLERENRLPERDRDLLEKLRRRSTAME